MNISSEYLDTSIDARQVYAENISWSRFPLYQRLMELIDNALDAEASRVEVLLDSRRFQVLDNGTGCSDLGLLIGYGRRLDHAKAGIGEYGVGAKKAIIYTAGWDCRIELAAAHAGIVSRAEYTISSLANGERVHRASSRSLDASSRGTVISISGALRGVDRSQIEKAVSKLGLHYTPAIRRGAVIEVNGRPVLPYAPPRGGERIDRRLIEIGGRRAWLSAVVVGDREKNPHHGCTVTYGGKCMWIASAFGTGSYKTPHLYAELDLDLASGWPVSVLKDDIVDRRLRQTLEAKVEKELEPLLILADEMARSSGLSSVEAAVSDKMRPLSVLTHGDPRKPASDGDSDSVEVKGKTKRKAKTKDKVRTKGGGSTTRTAAGRFSRKGIAMVFGHLPGEFGSHGPPLVGRFNGSEITLNLCHKAVAKIAAAIDSKAKAERDAAIEAAWHLAAAVLAASPLCPVIVGEDVESDMSPIARLSEVMSVVAGGVGWTTSVCASPKEVS